MPEDTATEKRHRSHGGVLVLLCLVAICVYGCVVRSLHLFNNSYHYVLSPDSHFFHWQAERLVSHIAIPMRLHSGLTYPLVYSAKAIDFIFDVPSVEALKWAGCLIPLLLSVITTVVLYVAISRMYSRCVALLSAFTWAAAGPAVFYQASGYLDRDGLSIVLVTVGVFAFYFSPDWRLRVLNVKMGWLLGVLSVLVIEVLLYIEWVWLAPLILLAVLVGVLVTEVAVEAFRGFWRLVMATEADLDVVSLAKDWLQLIVAASKRSNWRGLALILCLNLALAAIEPGLENLYRGLLAWAPSVARGTTSVAELGGISPNDLLGYRLFIFPALFGLYIAVKNGRRADTLLLGWFVCLFSVGLVSRRLFIYAAPSVCVFSGLALARLVDSKGLRFSAAVVYEALWFRSKMFIRYAGVAIGVIILCLCIVVSPPQAYNLPSGAFVAAGSDWVAAMTWLKENVPEEAVVVAHWNYGYWILDLAQRRPLVDNGLYGWDEERNHDVGLIYCATDPAEAAGMMQKYQADFVVFSTLDRAILPGITLDALGQSYGDGNSIPTKMRDSLYARSLSGVFVSGNGFRRVYPAATVGSPTIVILSFESNG